MRLLSVPGLLLIALSGHAADVTPATVAATHAELAWRAYRASLATAQDLQNRINAFVAAPDAMKLEACRTAWRAAHDAWSPTEVFRFQDGPIDRDGGPETKINAWPLDEQWVDATIDDPEAGLVNHAEIALTPDVLIEYNEKDGEKNISTGYHAIEFLLWGQDRDPKGPGARPPTDFTTAANAKRRGEYLRLAGELLVKHIASVAAEWEPGKANFRATFTATDHAKALHAAFTGLVMLAGDELSGERMAVAYETQDQEEEQSCFSDNTWADIQGNIAGMAMVWTGRLGEWQGPSLRDLVIAKDPARAKALDEAIAASAAAAKAIPQPFDQAILGGNDGPARTAVLASIEALEAQADATVAAAKAVDVALDFGANANNAIVGCKEIRENAIAITDALKAGRQDEARATADIMFKRWLTIESAITHASPTLYKEIESALFGLRAATKASGIRLAAAQTRAQALDGAIARILPLLKQ